MWGAGTALGELPPYFMARAARLSGEAPDDPEYQEFLALKRQMEGGPTDDVSLALETDCTTSVASIALSFQCGKCLSLGSTMHLLFKGLLSSGQVMRFPNRLLCPRHFVHAPLAQRLSHNFNQSGPFPASLSAFPIIKHDATGRDWDLGLQHLATRVKVWMEKLVKRVGFLGILLCASVSSSSPI